MSDNIDKALSLQSAYRISYEVKERSVAQLFWAMDRFYHDRAEVDEYAKHQRSEATQRIAKELDGRNVPLRDPSTIVFPRELPL